MNSIAESLVRGICIGIVCEVVRHFYTQWRERKVSETASDDKETLSERMIGNCLDANSDALNQFIHALAEYFVIKKQEEYSTIIEGLAPSLQFSPVKPHLNLTILQAIFATEHCQRRVQALREVQELFTDNTEMLPNETELLLNIHAAASQLIETRNALSKALRFYYFPSSKSLSGQFLAATYLYDSLGSLRRQSFASADFRNAILIGTHLERTNLTGANFENAVLIYAQLTATNLTGASFRDANLTNAKVTRADMTDVDLTGAKVAWSTLYLAENVDASWQDADFEGEKRRDNKLWRRMKAKFGTMEP